MFNSGNHILILIASIILCACAEKKKAGGFTLTGDLKNAADQKIYLEQLYFSQKPPEVIDTGEVKNGKFKVMGTAAEAGIFRLRLANSDAAYLFINDDNEINMKADLNDKTLAGYTFNGASNEKFKSFLTKLDGKIKALNAANSQPNDSAAEMNGAAQTELIKEYQQFILSSIDTVSDPVVAMFAVGNSRGVDTAALNKSVYNLTNRFPKHQGVKDLVSEYRSYFARVSETKQPAETARPGIGSMAPDFTMNDPQGKPFSLKDLRGKYVLVDFWASWCGPCRRENPNIVKAYKKYSKENFTILGVSLDEDREKWLEAIAADGLEWKQISDLQQWNSAAVPLYGFEGIPYNVLVDPEGKIIAKELRGEALDQKLDELF